MTGEKVMPPYPWKAHHVSSSNAFLGAHCDFFFLFEVYLHCPHLYKESRSLREALSGVTVEPLPRLTSPVVGSLYKQTMPKGRTLPPLQLRHHVSVIKAELFRESRRRGQQNKSPEEAFTFPLMPSGLCKPQHTHEPFPNLLS